MKWQILFAQICYIMQMCSIRQQIVFTHTYGQVLCSWIKYTEKKIFDFYVLYVRLYVWKINQKLRLILLKG